MIIAGIIALVVIGYVIWRVPSQEQMITKLLAMEAMIYREATVEEFRIMKEGAKAEQIRVGVEIAERLQKAGKL